MKDGGCLRLYAPAQGDDSSTGCADASDQDGAGHPNGQAAEASHHLDVLPMAGRLVVFMSGAVEHEVMPTFQPRCALTAWFS